MRSSFIGTIIKKWRKNFKNLLKKLTIYDKYEFKNLLKNFKLNKISTNFYENEKLNSNNILFDCKYKNIIKVLKTKNYEHNNIIVIYNDFKNKIKLKKHLTEINITYLKRNTKENLRYLQNSKYLFFDKEIPAYFIKKDGQAVFKIIENKIFEETEIWKQSKTIRSLIISDYIITDIEKIETYLKEINKYNIFLNKLIDFEYLKNNNWKFGKKLDQSNKKDIVFFPGYLKVNGVTETFITLLNELDYNKYNIFIILNNKFYKDKQLRLNKNVHVLYLNNNLFYKHKTEYMKINNFLKKAEICNNKILDEFAERNIKAIVGLKKFDYVIDYSGYMPLNALLASLGINSKEKIIYMHNDLYKDRLLKNFQLETVFMLYKNFDLLVSVSKSCLNANKKGAGQYILDKYKVDVINKMTYIINPVNYIKIFEDIKVNNILKRNGKEYIKIITPKEENSRYIEKPNSQNYNFITIGRLSPEKNQKMLIETFAKLEKKYKNIRLYILGDGILYKELEVLIKKVKLKNKIYLTGYTTNPFELLNMCNCFVLPSIYEGMGMVVIEALILNKVVISSNIDGPSEFLKGGYGILVNLNENNFYNAMESCLSSKIKFKKFNYKEHNKKAIKLFYENVLNIK